MDYYAEPTTWRPVLALPPLDPFPTQLESPHIVVKTLETQLENLHSDPPALDTTRSHLAAARALLDPRTLDVLGSSYDDLETAMEKVDERVQELRGKAPRGEWIEGAEFEEVEREMARCKDLRRGWGDGGFGRERNGGEERILEEGGEAEESEGESAAREAGRKARTALAEGLGRPGE